MLVHHVGPGRIVLLPRGEPPPDLVALIKKHVSFEPGKSSFVAAIEAGVEPTKIYHLAVIGQLAGLWKMWPEYWNPLWRFDHRHLPLLQ
jgi:hypothetical protein